MKIQLLSDLHNEFIPLEYQQTDADVVILAGDIDVKKRGLTWALETITDKPVIYVLGNHEYYNAAYPKLMTDLKKAASGTNVHVFENDVFTYEDVNFFGCSLWTDFKLTGNQPLAAYDCQDAMSDYSKIRKSPKYSKLRAEDTIAINSQSVEFLTRELKARQGQKNVVVTHHAPSLFSISESDKFARYAPAYASNLDALVEKANAWLHGHTHHSLDYMIGDCRVLCNPRGYAPNHLNKDFEPNLMIEI